jgi:hypothetical protein
MVHRRAVLSVDHRRLGAEARDCIGNRVSMIKVAMTRTDEVFGTRKIDGFIAQVEPPRPGFSAVDSVTGREPAIPANSS